MAKQMGLMPRQLNRSFSCSPKTDGQTAPPPYPSPSHPCLETALPMTSSSQAFPRVLASSAAALSVLHTL